MPSSTVTAVMRVRGNRFQSLWRIMRSVKLSFPPDTATATWSSGLNMSQWLMVRRTFRSNESLRQLLHRIVPSYSLRKYAGLRLHTVHDLRSIGSISEILYRTGCRIELCWSSKERGRQRWRLFERFWYFSGPEPPRGYPGTDPRQTEREAAY